MLKVYVSPSVRVNVGFSSPFITYADAPLLLTSNAVTSGMKLVCVVSITKLPLIVEPKSGDCTINPASTSTDAVTEPVAIRIASSVSADIGISNKPAPLPE